MLYNTFYFFNNESHHEEHVHKFHFTFYKTIYCFGFIEKNYSQLQN